MLADRVTPPGRWYWLKLPESEKAGFIFTKHVDFGGVWRGRWQVVVDQYNGNILHVATPLSGGLGNAFLQWQWPLHSGQFFALAWADFGAAVRHRLCWTFRYRTDPLAATAPGRSARSVAARVCQTLERA